MTRIVLNFGLCLALCGALALAASGGCPDKNGRYAVPGQCDAYLECIEGVAEEKLCPDGLLFNEKNIFSYPCSYPIDVQCEQSKRIQTAQPTDECPHQFGYFRMGDASHCGQFMNCASGKGYIIDCPEGLAWNPATYQCDWPDVVEGCDAEAFLGFKCPQIAKSELLGQEEYRFYPSPNDCQRFFICIDGKPRLNNCGEGRGFNAELNACDDLANFTCGASSRTPVKSAPVQKTVSKAPAQSAFGKPTQSAFGKPTQSAFGKPTQSAFGKPTQSAFGKPQQSAFGGNAFSKTTPQQQQQSQRGAYRPQPAQQQNSGRPNSG